MKSGLVCKAVQMESNGPILRSLANFNKEKIRGLSIKTPSFRIGKTIATGVTYARTLAIQRNKRSKLSIRLGLCL